MPIIVLADQGLKLKLNSKVSNGGDISDMHFEFVTFQVPYT